MSSNDVLEGLANDGFELSNVRARIRGTEYFCFTKGDERVVYDQRTGQIVERYIAKPIQWPEDGNNS